MNRRYDKRARIVIPERRDHYAVTEKYPKPTACADCGSLFENGRWTANKMYPTADVFLAKCPACRRKTGHDPAGDIKIKGVFAHEHHDEIIGRIRRIERREKAMHPVEQILAMSDAPDETNIATTGIHLARRIGNGLRRSYKGELSYSYGKGEKSIQVVWER